MTITPNGNALTIDWAGAGGSGMWHVKGNDAYYNSCNAAIGTMVPLTPLEVSGIPRSKRTGIAPEHIQINGGDCGPIQLTVQSALAGEKNLFIENLSGEGTPGADNNIEFVLGTTASPSTKMTLTKEGDVILPLGGTGGGIIIGTPNFETGMSIVGPQRADVRFKASTFKLLAGAGVGIPSSANGIAISTDGNIGIGTISAFYKLEVAGDPGITGRILVNGFNSRALTMGLQTRSGDDYPFVVRDASGNEIFSLSAGVKILSMHGDAQKSSGGTSWLTSSDRRLKQDVRAYGPGLNEVLKPRPLGFRYSDDPKRGLTSTHEEIGFVAQEVRDVIPDAITEGQDGYLTLKADPIDWASITAIQELNAKLEEQREEKDTEIAQLKQRLEELEQLMNHKLGGTQ